MKKSLVYMLVCLLVVGCMGFVEGNCLAAVKPVDSPQYELTKRTYVTLDISSTGKASCTGYVRASSSDSTIDITMKLKVKDGNAWRTYKSWTETGATSYIKLSKTCNVEPGIYKLVVTGTVKSSSGKTETVSTPSGEKTYKK